MADTLRELGRIDRKDVDPDGRSDRESGEPVQLDPDDFDPDDLDEIDEDEIDDDSDDEVPA